MQPLSHRERTELIRILSASAQDAHHLQSRQKAALDAYLHALSQPPLDAREVLDSARALIRTWAEVREAADPPRPRKPSEVRGRVISAELLDPPVSAMGGTEQLSPMSLTAVFESYGYERSSSGSSGR